MLLQLRIVRDPPPEAWNRVRRYASWMHEVHVLEWSTLGEDTFRVLRLNSPAGGWFPALQDLFWIITEHNLPHADLFFSPHLKEVTMNVSGSWGNTSIPRYVLSTITSILFALPTSALQLLVIGIDGRGAPWADFKELFSSVVLRCGPSLTGFTSPAPLSDTAMNHLIQLPHLHTWSTGGPPPNSSPSSLSPVFPSLAQLTLRDGAACGWLPLLERLEHNVLTTKGVTPLSGMKESLRFLDVYNPSGCALNVSFTLPIQMFRNLISLNVQVCCRGGNARCGFELSDDDVAKLAIALPQLDSLFLGHPCFRNTCATTAICLLSISTYCVKLRYLEIHFNTTNIVDNLKTALEDPRFEALRSRPRCTLSCLEVHWLPLTLDESGFEMVADGMADIFPSLERCEGASEYSGWRELSERITVLREVRTFPTS